MPELLPNSIPQHQKVDWSISSGGVEWLYTFCANCGARGPRVMKTDMPENFAFYLCDEKQNDCVSKWTHLVDVMLVPDEVFFEKVKQAQIEKYGHMLSLQELAAELENDSSVMSKLKKEASQCR